MRCVFLATVLFLAASCARHSETTRAAVVNGEPISVREVEEVANLDLLKLEERKAQFDVQFSRDRKAAIESALDKVINSRLFEAEAKKRKVTVAELRKLEIDDAVSPAPDDVLLQFYLQNKEKISGTFEENKTALRKYLLDRDRSAAAEALLTRLHREYEVKRLLEPDRVKFDSAGHPSKGPRDAPLTLVEFSDFECPYCAGLFPTLKQIEENYGHDVRIVYFQFPLDIHSHAAKAAEASLCANDQGKFWDFHNSLFGDQNKLSHNDLADRAKSLNLDMPSFNNCLDSGRHRETVEKDISQGIRLGVNATPTIFVNGRFLQGAQPYPVIEKVIKEELHRR